MGLSPGTVTGAALSDAGRLDTPSAAGAEGDPCGTDPSGAEALLRPEGFRRVSRWLAESGHAHAPQWLSVPARTCAEAAQALGVEVGQIAKSVIFRRRSDDAAVLVVAAGDQRVDTAKVAAAVGPVGRADAAFVKAKTGFSIGGVAPVGHAQPPVVLIDQTLARFDAIWAAAGHPNGVFRLSLDELCALTGVGPRDVAVSGAHPAGNACDLNSES